MLERWWRETITGQRAGPGAALARALLTALALPYGAAMRANLAIYEHGLKVRTHPAIPVASVGNITLGGTGKTTATRRLARDLVARGVTPGIVLRGHRREGRGDVLVSDGSEVTADAEAVGDEACMLACTTPGALVAVGARRERVIEMLGQSGADVALLDDGFQYFRMQRHVDLVLIDATFDLGNARLFPRGYLREPLDHLRRATHVLITHEDLAPATQVRRLSQIVSRYAPNAPVILSRHAPSGVYPVDEAGDIAAAATLAGQRVLAMSAIGNPASFEGLLLQLGARVASRLEFPDHHQYRPEDWARAREKLRTADADLIAVTEKDVVKLPPPPSDLPPVVAVAVDLQITSNEQAWEALVGSIYEAARQESAAS